VLLGDAAFIAMTNTDPHRRCGRRSWEDQKALCHCAAPEHTIFAHFYSQPESKDEMREFAEWHRPLFHGNEPDTHLPKYSCHSALELRFVVKLAFLNSPTARW